MKELSENIMIDDHGYDASHINGIIDLTEKGIYRQSPVKTQDIKT